MTTRFHTAAAILCLFLGLGSVSGFAADNRPLKGLSRLWVLIESLHPDLRKAGLTQDRLREDIETRLRDAGIAVDSGKTLPGEPFLYLELSVLSGPDEAKPSRKRKAFRKDSSSAPSPIYVRLELQQGVVLKRDPSASLITDTWHQTVIGYPEAGQVGEMCQSWARELTERFLKAYSAVNSAR
ncbi:MAG: hypothetical protein M3Z85_11610 [Acidobacteriota bacterium]|nr:hypothetical protein [Acidobacteriota bacterium]